MAVVHDDPTHHLVDISCPLFYEFGTELRQYHLQKTTENESTHLFVNQGGEPALRTRV